MPGAVFASPGAFSIAATAADAGGSVSRVDFYQGGTLIGTDTTPPYGLACFRLAGRRPRLHGGRHRQPQRDHGQPADRRDGRGSPPRRRPGSMPTSAVVALGSASFAGSTFTVRGSGADIAGASDEFHYTYQPVSGNVTIVARVATIQNTNAVGAGGDHDPREPRGQLPPRRDAADAVSGQLLPPPHVDRGCRRVDGGPGRARRPSGSSSCAPDRPSPAPFRRTASPGRSSDPAPSPCRPTPWSASRVTSRINGTVNTSTFDGVSVTAP